MVKKRLSDGPIDVEFDYIVGQRVQFSIKTPNSSTGEKGTIVSLEIVHTLKWEETFAGPSKIQEKSTVYYTLLTDDQRLFRQSNPNLTITINRILNEEKEEVAREKLK